jgi:Phage terminase, small subunit
MSRVNWKEVLIRFAGEWRHTDIPPEDWCHKEGLPWGSAKRYITIKALKLYLETGEFLWENKTANSQLKKSAQKPEINDERESISDGENQTERITDLGFDPAEFGISGQQALFVYWYVKTKNRVEAYKEAKYQCEGNSAYAAASRMYRNVKVSKAIRALENRVRERYAADLDEIVDQLVAITRADPNLISQYRRVNCRYCWGEHNLYQWRDIKEFDRAAAKNAKDGKPEPEYGGLGFINNMDPNPDCPKCNGEGEGEIKLGDTRDFDVNEQAYYLGVKQTKNGIEIITESKQSARAQLLKIIEVRKNLAVKNSDPVVGSEPEERDDLTDEQLHEALEDLGYGRRKNQLEEKLDDS